ncbi:pimeloyl-ACP methyl ester carboxylesterase [Micromonospora pisi]|uniref:Pimeloyl-ACP methyl ester carboxylesterase n=1 Tax=Micromonospora pisi TaxID=589240 RepID=A0A495JKS3_9ACTN|nr:alpha/beta hydrolase [Micromonospora pisi]RKR88942.1 pimeloyl-ACP methyl ester carboxylesterase [Micromonospora pisi]
MNRTPSVLLVHGAWHGPWVWQSLVEQLPDIDIHTVALPSSGNDPAALGDLYDDAAVVKAAVAAIDGPVVVVAHSYAGAPVTEALSAAENVLRIVYLAAFQLDVGDSLFSSAGGVAPPWWEVHEQAELKGKGHIKASQPREVFYGDVDPEIAEQAVAQLGLQGWASTQQPLTRAAWQTIPSTYIICEADNAIPPFVQELMAKRAERVLRMNSSHSPFLSQPAELAALIRAELSA